MFRLATIFSASGLFFACDNQPQTEGLPEEPVVEASRTLTVYSGRKESLVGDLLLRAEAELGIDIEVQYDGTSTLVTRMLAEGEESPADMIFSQDSGHLGALTERNMLMVLPADILAPVDPRFQDAAGHWVGTSGRLRALVYNTERVSADSLPQSLEDLADPKWNGRLGWAPSNGSFLAHVSALRHLWGEEKTRAWLEGVAANAPTRFESNSPQVVAAGDGTIEMGWVNHYYLYRVDLETTPVANHSFPEDGDGGNVLMLAGVGIRNGSPNAAAARELVSWLLSEEAQTYFAQQTYEYPTRMGVPTHAAVPALRPDQLAAVEQAWLSDLGPTRTLLQELGIQ